METTSEEVETDEGDQDDNIDPDMFFESSDNVIENRETSPVMEQDPVDPSSDSEVNTYDISLPIEHRYLGGLNNITGERFHIYKPGSIVQLKTIYLNGLFLFPGQEIPLTFNDRGKINLLLSVIRNNSNRTFGLLIGLISYRIGTTAEIQSFNINEDNSEIKIKITGRQRFVIVEDFTNQRNQFEPKVKILPDIDQYDFFRHAIQSEPYLSKAHRPLITSIPLVALKQMDNRYLMERIKNELTNIFHASVNQERFVFPIDPTTFSYFVLMAIPLPDLVKMKLMEMDSVNLRLKMEYELLAQNFNFTCSMCCKKICYKNSMLVMSKVGTSGTFINSYGIIHELYTFSSVKNISRISELTEDHTWFPNYGWIIIRCKRCKSHLGWEFRTKNPNIQPTKFFALRKNSIHLSFRVNLDDRSGGLLFSFFHHHFLVPDEPV